MTIDADALSDQLNRMVKLALDTGEAATLEEAQALFAGYALRVAVGAVAARSPTHQIALLTIVNAARRSLLGGVYVEGALTEALLVPFGDGSLSIADAVTAMGARVGAPPLGAPLIVLGDPDINGAEGFAVRVTFQGWCGGCIPINDTEGLPETWGFAPAGVVAGALAVSEAFQHLRGSNAIAGRRRVGLSLWRPEIPWTDPAGLGVPPKRLPASAWIIGLGNLGQAYLWTMGFLPYADASAVRLVLQDTDILAPSNDSTSLLTELEMVGERKARVMAGWAKTRGFTTDIVERRFGPDFRVLADEPAVALCGIDNALGRAALEEVGFERIFEAGLGKGTSDFLALRMHSFPAGRAARGLWGDAVADEQNSVLDQPAYRTLAQTGVDQCGLARLAGRTVGAPFVGAVAASLVISELVRLTIGAQNYELVDLHLRAPEHAIFVAQGPEFSFNPSGVASA